MSDIKSVSKQKILKSLQNRKIPLYIKKFEGIQKIKASNEIKKRIEDSNKIDLIVNRNKELFDIKTLSSSIDYNRRERRSLSFKAIDKDSYKDKERNKSLEQNQLNNAYNDNKNIYHALNTTHGNSKSNEKVASKHQKAPPKIDFPVTKPLKLNLSLAKNSEKETFFKAIKKMNLSMDKTSKSGNTIINIHNNINIKIKDNNVGNSVDHQTSKTKFYPNQHNQTSPKISPIKSIQEIVKKNNYLFDNKDLNFLHKKTSINPHEILVNNNNFIKHGNIPLKLLNLNPKVIKISSLMKPRNKINSKAKVQITTHHNENSLISFDESLISKRKKDKSQSQSQSQSRSHDKQDKNEEVSLSYSDDEKNSKPIKNKEKNMKKLFNSIDLMEDQQSDNETEFLNFCENLNKKILNR